MNNKLLLQDLTDQLAEAGKIKKKDAEEFLRAFFKVSEDALFEDGIVKISGLGTLKLVLVDARKSVNVSTGEEFEIGEHYKVSFIPDADLKNSVNLPYAHLEPVELDGRAESIAPIADKKSGTLKEKPTKNKPEKIKSDSPKGLKNNKRSTALWILFFLLIVILGVWSWISNDKRRKENVVKINEIELIDSLEADVTLQQDLAALEQESDTMLNNTPDDSLESVVQSVANETGAAKPEIAQVAQKPAVTKQVTTVSKPINSPAIQAVTTKNQIRSVTKTTVPVVKPAVEKTPATPVKAVTSLPKTTSKTVKPVTPATSVDYIATIVLKPGDRLNLLALKYYGDKVFWVYIYQANKSVIPNPDNVPTGITIRIPKADPKLIDPNNPALIAKAKALQLQYIGAH